MPVVGSMFSRGDEGSLSARRRARRGWARPLGGLAVACASVCLLALALASSSASAAEYVDGISDQDMTSWDHGFGSSSFFTEFFKNTWLPTGHIKYSRFILGWTETSEAAGSHNNPAYRSWCADAGSMGLTLDLSITTYEEGENPRPTAATYKADLKALLEQCPAVRIVEPWNEPNHGGENTKTKESTGTFVNPTRAAEYAKEAAGLCNTFGCKIVVGNLLDGESNMVKWEKEYKEALAGWTLPYWGLHPYLAVLDKSMTTVSEFEANWGDGASSLWVTEVGAYNCLRKEVYGELSQAEDAKWLVQNLPKPKWCFITRSWRGTALIHSRNAKRTMNLIRLCMCRAVIRLCRIGRVRRRRGSLETRGNLGRIRAAPEPCTSAMPIWRVAPIRRGTALTITISTVLRQPPKETLLRLAPGAVSKTRMRIWVWKV